MKKISTLPMLLAACLAVGTLCAQSSTSGQSGSQPPSSGQGTQQGTPSQATPADSTDTTPSSTPAASQGTSGSDTGGGYHFTPGDILAPLSRARFGPFQMYSMDLTTSWSNQPLDANIGGSTSPLPIDNGQTAWDTRASISMGARWRWGPGFVGIVYNPVYDYDAVAGVRELNHNLSAFVDRGLRVGRWRVAFGLNTITQNQYSSFYETPALAPAVDVVPVTNLDLQELLNQPQALQPLVPNLILLSERVLTAQGRMSITRPISRRDSITVTSTYTRLQVLSTSQGQSFAPLIGQGGWQVNVNWNHAMSGRWMCGAGTTGGASFGTGQGNGAQETGIAVSCTYHPNRRVTVSGSVGPQLVQAPGTGFALTAAYSGTISTKIFGAGISAGYSNAFDFLGFAGGQNSKNVNLNWTSPPPKGHRWSYTFTVAYQLASSAVQQTETVSIPGLPAQIISEPTLGQGFNLGASFFYPITHSLMFSTRYGYYFQTVNYGNDNSNPVTSYNRNVVTGGLRYSFGVLPPGRY